MIFPWQFCPGDFFSAKLTFFTRICKPDSLNVEFREQSLGGRDNRGLAEGGEEGGVGYEPEDVVGGEAGGGVGGEVGVAAHDADE